MAIQPQILLTVGKSPESRLRLINIESEKYPEFERTLDEDIDIDQSHPYWWNYFLCGLKGSYLIKPYIFIDLGNLYKSKCKYV